MTSIPPLPEVFYDYPILALHKEYEDNLKRKDDMSSLEKVREGLKTKLLLEDRGHPIVIFPPGNSLYRYPRTVTLSLPPKFSTAES